MPSSGDVDAVEQHGTGLLHKDAQDYAHDSMAPDRVAGDWPLASGFWVARTTEVARIAARPEMIDASSIASRCGRHHHRFMQTTVDLDPATLERAKRVARRENRTLGSVLSDALAAYVSRQPPRSSDPPFELIVRGRPGGRFPSAEELAKIEEEEETRALRIPEGRNAAS